MTVDRDPFVGAIPIPAGDYAEETAELMALLGDVAALLDLTRDVEARAKLARDRAMVTLHYRGETLANVGEVAGVGKQRAHQIITRGKEGTGT